MGTVQQPGNVWHTHKPLVLYPLHPLHFKTMQLLNKEKVQTTRLALHQLETSAEQFLVTGLTGSTARAYAVQVK